MSTHALTVKQILSRVRELFPNVQETYMMALINDALTDAGSLNVKYESATTSSVADKKWYAIDDTNSGIELNKINSVYFLDNDDKYRRIRRLLTSGTSEEDTI